MQGSLTIKMAFTVALAFVLVSGSRDESDQVVEVAASNHFVSHKNIREVQKHNVDTSPASAATITPEMRKQIAAFGKAAVAALANDNNPDMKNEDKAMSLHAALSQAASAVTSIASSMDLEKNPKLAKHIASLNSMEPPSFIEEHQDNMPASSEEPPAAQVMTPEIRAQVMAFSKAASLALREDPEMSLQDKASRVHEALSQAVSSLESVATLAHADKKGMLTEKLAHLKDLVVRKDANAMIQEREESRPDSTAEPESANRMTPSMQAQVRSFGKAASKVLANAEDPSLSTSEKAEHVEAALTQFTQAIKSMSSLPDLKKSPELMAALKDLP